MSEKYGQHFLEDEFVLLDIVETISGTKEKIGSDRMIEIGPGQGVLTQHIVDKFDHVTLYEIDESMRARLYPQISGHPDAKMIWGDVLEMNVLDARKGETDIENTLVVGNLPYYITSPILRKFFEPTPERVYPGGVFLVQKEVAQKISSSSSKKSFLRRVVNFWYDVEYKFTVPPTAFNPPPKVNSAVFTLILHPEKKKRSLESYTRMMKFLDIISGLKRKTLGKTRKIRAELLDDYVLPEEIKSKRLEELEWKDMWNILGESYE